MTEKDLLEAGFIKDKDPMFPYRKELIAWDEVEEMDSSQAPTILEIPEGELRDRDPMRSTRRCWLPTSMLPTGGSPWAKKEGGGEFSGMESNFGAEPILEGDTQAYV